MTEIRVTKAELLARFEEQIAIAERYDIKALADHRKAEAASVVTFRKKLREAAKMDYAELTANKPRHYGTYSVSHQPPSCPLSMADQFRRALANQRWDSRSAMLLSENGKNAGLFKLYTWTPEPPVRVKDLCS